MVGLIGGVVSVSISRGEQHAVNIPQGQLLFMSQHVCPGSHQLLITELLLHQLHQLHGWTSPHNQLRLDLNRPNPEHQRSHSRTACGGGGPRGDTMETTQLGPTSNRKT